MFLNVSFPDRNFSVGMLLDDVWVHSVNSFLLLAEHPTRQLLVDFFIFYFFAEHSVYVCPCNPYLWNPRWWHTPVLKTLLRCLMRCFMFVLEALLWQRKKIIFWTAYNTKNCRQGSAPFLCSQFGKEHFLFLLFIRKDFSQQSAQLTVTEMFLLFSNVT